MRRHAQIGFGFCSAADEALVLRHEAATHVRVATTIASPPLLGEGYAGRSERPDDPLAGMVSQTGGSHLCADNFCFRCRPVSRQPASTGFGTSHIGFRTVRRVSQGPSPPRFRGSEAPCKPQLRSFSHWTVGAPFNRSHLIMSNEDNPSALRFGPWKSHFRVRDGFFGYIKDSALIFNLRMDPFEQRDGHPSNLLAMKKAFLGGVIRDIMGAHAMSLRQHPPRQSGGTPRPQ